MGANRTRSVILGHPGFAKKGRRAVNIVVPIFFAAVIVGLFAKRMTPPVWAGLAAFIFLVIAYRFLKN